MAQKIVIDLEAKADKALKDVKALKNEFDSLESSVNDVSDASDKTKKSIDDVASNGGAIAILDQLTGGLASQFKNAYESTRLFNFSLKGTKKALIASGVGILVVALGTVVAYWDDIVELINRTNKKLETQESYLTEQLKTQTLQLELLKQQIDIDVLRNGESPKLTAEYRKQLVIQREQNIALLENLQTQLEIEESKNKEVTNWEKIKIAASGQLGFSLQAELIAKATNKNSERSVELTEKINEAKKKTGAIDLQLAQIDADVIKKKKENDDKDLKAEKEKADAIERIRKGLIDTEEERRAEALRKIEDDYKEQIKLAEKYYGEESQKVKDLKEAQKNALDQQQAKFDEQDKKKAEEQQKIDDEKDALRKKELQVKEDERLKKLKEQADEEIRIAKAVVEQKKALQEQNLNNLANGFSLLGQLAGKNKTLQKAAIIGESAVGIARTIIQTSTSNAFAIAQGAALAIPTAGASVAAAAKLVVANKIGAGLNIAANIAATAKGLSALGGKGTAPSRPNIPTSGGGSSPDISQPPSFNVVGASDTNQLADAIGSQSQEPTRAYVVSNDVTTAQSMDRNIVDGASI